MFHESFRDKLSFDQEKLLRPGGNRDVDIQFLSKIYVQKTPYSLKGSSVEYNDVESFDPIEFLKALE